MAKFIEVTDSYGSKILINVEEITFIRTSGSGDKSSTLIHFTGTTYDQNLSFITIKEHYDTLKDMIKKAN